MRTLILILSSFFLLQCSGTGSSNQNETCDAPPPQSIFNEGVSQIKSHKFILTGHNSEENIKFDDGSTLIIFQSGCEKIAQEFRFHLEPNKEMDMASLGIERLMFLANLEDKYMSFANWAEAIDALRQEFANANDVEVEPGFYVGLDKIDGNNQTTMVVRLFQK